MEALESDPEVAEVEISPEGEGCPGDRLDLDPRKRKARFGKECTYIHTRCFCLCLFRFLSTIIPLPTLLPPLWVPCTLQGGGGRRDAAVPSSSWGSPLTDPCTISAPEREGIRPQRPPREGEAASSSRGRQSESIEFT